MNEIFSSKRINRILVIDDDEDDSLLLTEAIAEADGEIKCTSILNGIDALDYLKSNPDTLPDLIFLDLNMPRMDGKGFLREILKDPELHNIPVIVYSTSKLLQDVEETKILGAIHFIAKPYTFAGLKQEVNNVLAMPLAAVA